MRLFHQTSPLNPLSSWRGDFKSSLKKNFSPFSTLEKGVGGMRFTYKILGIIILLLLPLSFTPIHAQTPPERMARYMPADVDFFAVIRSDSDFITRLDTLFMTVSEQLPNSLSQTLSINELINQVVAQSVTLPIQLDFVSVLDQALGDWAGIGIDGIPESVANPDSPVSLYLTLDIGDYRTAQMLLNLMVAALGLEMRSAIEDYMVYGLDDFTLALNQTLLHITYRADLSPIVNQSLQTVVLFTDGIRQLPQSDYDLWAYFNTPAVSLPFIQDAIITRILGSFGVDNTTTGAGVAGILVGDDSLTIDLIQRRDAPQAQTNTPINPAFWAFIPSQAQFFIHTTDFTNLIESASSVLAAISASDTPELVMRDFMQLTQVFLNADLQNDILSWTTGDYALWGKILPISSAHPNSVNPFYFGWVFQTTSPQNSRRLVDVLATAAETYFSDDSLFMIHRTRMNTSDVAFITLPSNRSAFFPPEIAIGANDDIFFIATPAAAQDLLTRHDGYLWAIPRLVPTFLDIPKVALYLNGDAVGEIGVLFATLIQPVQTFFFGETLTPEAIQAYRTAFAQLFPALSLSAKAGNGGDVIIRFVAQINAVSEGDIPSE